MESARSHAEGRCDWCGAELPPRHPKARGVQRFCKASHRTAWGRQERRKLLEEARERLDKVLR